MDDKLKARLAALLAEDQERKRRAETREEARKTAEEVFNEQFLGIAGAVIEPAFRDFAAVVEEAGWATEIFTQPDRTDAKGLASAARSSIYFYRGGKGRGFADHNHPHFEVICDEAKQSVWFRSSTMGPGHGGSGGSAGQAKLEELNPDLIHEKLAEYFEKLLRDSTPYYQR